MTVDLIRSDGRLFDGVSYAYAAATDAGCLIFTAGACPLDEQGSVVAIGDLEGQADRAVENLFAVLAAAGSSPELVLKTTIYVAASERADLVQAWNVVRRRFGDVDPPSTLLGMSFLGYPGQLVEIEAVAVAARSV